MRTREITAGLAAVAMALLLGACADETTDPGDPASPPATPNPPMPSAPSELQTITGEVAEGVEPGCVVLLTPEQDEYLLVGSVGELEFGEEATLRGHPDPDMPTTCQQGTPFVLVEVVSP